jgi:hypothetical protein
MSSERGESRGQTGSEQLAKARAAVRRSPIPVDSKVWNDGVEGVLGSDGLVGDSRTCRIVGAGRRQRGLLGAAPLTRVKPKVLLLCTLVSALWAAKFRRREGERWESANSRSESGARLG